MQKVENYKNAVNKLYSKVSSFDNPGYIYSLRNPVGFYQRMMVLRNLIKILNRNHIQLSKFNSILDLGCGIGYWLRIIAEMRGNAKRLIGVDLSEERLNYAEKINKNIKWTKADMCNLPFKDKSFDFVTAFVSFMFLIQEKDLKKAILEVVRVLKNDGFFLFYDVIGNKKLSEFTRGFQIKEIKELFSCAGLRLVDKQPCFRNIFGMRRFSTAYLSSKIPIEILLWLEKIPFSKPNNILLLFRKGNRL
jgi:ubiquinone/menaquinone biosynthesis C-methylase UbiE